MEKRPVILAVDDHKPILKLLRVNLSLEGYDVVTASDGFSALQLLDELEPDLAILDLMMPGKSGIELLPELKAICPDTAVIVVTGIADTDTAVRCMKQGAYDYLTKPFDLDEVVLSVARALEKRRLELENRDYQQHLQQKVQEQSEKIRASFLGAITALAHALEAKDRYTGGHSQRVSELSAAIAQELGASADDIEKIKLAGLVHDIGKIGVIEAVLDKPEGLTAEEYRQVTLHCEIGECILSPIIEDKDILEMVRHHHERFDGTGYPDRLSGGQLRLGARILAVADSYDAMTSERPYRAALSEDKALEEIKRASGTQFDPEVVNAFLKVEGPAVSEACQSACASIS